MHDTWQWSTALATPPASSRLSVCVLISPAHHMLYTCRCQWCQIRSCLHPAPPPLWRYASGQLWSVPALNPCAWSVQSLACTSGSFALVALQQYQSAVLASACLSAAGTLRQGHALCVYPCMCLSCGCWDTCNSVCVCAGVHLLMWVGRTAVPHQDCSPHTIHNDCADTGLPVPTLAS
jgi:hypothetical protein